MRFLIVFIGSLYILSKLIMLDSWDWSVIGMSIVGAIAALFLLIHFLEKYENKHFEPEEYEEWEGQMSCNKCGYVWQSRRNTPPSRCAGCSTNNISANMIKKTRMVPKEKNQTDS
ncbi:hypothetical protein RI845_07385 [Thalassotalea nanhaiensis]|uniref:Hydrogenase maturation nickel metallochaperone HypA n=1 Tax=Thalassotalea nanhaiensis TaxID=3065648 RepID=A0ABY9TQC8_9GAMM|nr:hypothetical protein RI845_07385 [Colwelliaceae bacterium SQ345]